MPFNTFTVASAVTPSVIETYFSHYLNRGPLRQKPTAHISYHEGLRLIRQFLDYSSKHTIEDLQGFTAQWVPVPTWVRTQDVEVPPQFLERAAKILRSQLGIGGLEQIGGEKWWQWRRPEIPLKAEWIEMKKDHNERKRNNTRCDRVILYVHGGAYYFGSVDEHRYQMQRHARKLKARVLAPRYRLAPQFPFPAGLYDCIATYFYLLEHFPPSQILVAGDSAGGGMVLSMLVVLRDQGCPLPAGTILLSPWVDLTHSFPSVSGDGAGDYIPPHGFHHKPSLAWPPPPTEKLKRKFTQPVDHPFDVVELPATAGLDMKSSRSMTKSRDDLRAEAEQQAKRKKVEVDRNTVPGLGLKLEVDIDGKAIEINEQIQIYAKNDLLTHPLVSPVQQPSLGGLPPMLIQVGGAELLRDEQVYLAHKAANPQEFPPSDAILDEYDPQRNILNHFPPTNVQLQVWDDLCHVPHTLSFTRPSKYCYRSVAQFGAWALAHAEQKSVEIQDDDAISIISDKSDGESVAGSSLDSPSKKTNGRMGNDAAQDSVGSVGKAGDALPPFKDHMIRQRVDRHGLLYPLPLQSEIACLHLDPATIGAIKPGPVRKWLAKKAEHQSKFANEFKKVQKKRVKEAAQGYDTIAGEEPPPTALVRRRVKGVAPEAKKKGKSWGLAMWSGWGSSHDESTLEREEKAMESNATREGVSTSDPKAGMQESAVASGSNGHEASASTNNLAVPSEKTEKELKKARRTSVFSTHRSQKAKVAEDPPRPKSSYRKVEDAGQVESDRHSAVSPLSSMPPTRTGSLRTLTRDGSMRSIAHPYDVGPSTPSGRPRPMSVFAPIPVTSLDSAERRKAPDQSPLSKEAVKVPGSQGTYLNAQSSRPHDGTVAYPFKLKQGEDPTGQAASENASTRTLEGSAGASETGVVSELAAGDTSLAAELSAEPESARQASSVRPAELSATSGRPSTPEYLASGLDPASAAILTAALSTAPYPSVSVSQPSLAAQPLSTMAKKLAPVQTPINTNTAGLPAEPAGTTPSSAASNASSRLGNLNHRDSRLGNLGADGMPTAAFPTRAPPPPPASASIDSPTTVEQADSAQASAMSSPTEPTAKPAPFKLRNPVFDARAENHAVSPIAESPTPSTPDASKSPDSISKPAPFKLRHTIYDPKVAPPGSKPPNIPLPAIPGSKSPTTPKEPTSPVPPKPNSAAAPSPHAVPNDLPPGSNVTMPTIATRRPVPLAQTHGENADDYDDDVPPTPPPKDDPPKMSHANGVTTPGKKVPSVPVSQLSAAPSIGDLSFEKSGEGLGEAIGEPSTATTTSTSTSTATTLPLPVSRLARPQLETFVTAFEGNESAERGEKSS